MPTLVAHRVAPRNACAYPDSSGSSQRPTRSASRNGPTTPTVATSSAERPTRSMSEMRDSSPTWKSRTIAPMPASISTPESDRMALPNPPMLPSSMPPTSSPSTAGWPMRTARSPPSLATTSINATKSTTPATGSTCTRAFCYGEAILRTCSAIASAAVSPGESIPYRFTNRGSPWMMKSARG